MDAKVKERTLQLELSKKELLRVVREKEFEIKRLSGAITEAVNTIEGLCSTGKHDAPDLAAYYISGIHKTISRLAKICH